jgi:hypothetical protein
VMPKKRSVLAWSEIQTGLSCSATSKIFEKTSQVKPSKW